MNQKLALSMFFGGLSTFLMSLGELLTSHASWSSMTTPNEVGHIMVITATFCMIVAGALGINLSRDKNSCIDDNKENK